MQDQAVRILLDVTRLVSRAGTGALTGVDRVELAYLDWCLSGPGQARFLLRSTRGYLLLGPEGGARLARLARGELIPGRADALSRLAGRGGEMRHRVEAVLRGLALGRSRVRGLSNMLRRHVPGPLVYLNTGHSNLTDRTLSGIRALGRDARIAILVHDVIPLDYPGLVAEGQPARFAAAMARVARRADLIIANSADTLARFRARVPQPANPPAGIVAHLGTAPPGPVGALPDGVDADRPRFVALGTIEPRKNHALLLDAWERLARDMPAAALPHLHIVGRRGWRNEALFARLDAHPLRGRAIFEHGPLPDAAARALLAGSRALLYPSLAEGFGLPPVEALRLGVLPVCADLPALREVLGAHAIYLDPADAYSWAETIRQRIGGRVAPRAGTGFEPPDWQAHFGTVAAALAAMRPDGQKGTE